MIAYVQVHPTTQRASASIRRPLASTAALLAALSLAGCSSSVTPPRTTASATASPTVSAVTDAAGLAKEDGASDQTAVYQKVLAKFAAHCQEGTLIAFSVDTDTTVLQQQGRKITRLQLMNDVEPLLPAASGLNCTSELLDYQSAISSGLSTPSTPATLPLETASP